MLLPFRRLVASIKFGVLCLFFSSIPASGDALNSVAKSLRVRLPGEFEHQHALLLSCHELVEKMPELFVEIVRRVHGRTHIVALVSDIEVYQQATTLLKNNMIPLTQVRFVEMALNTMWVRDYGPMILETDAGQAVVLDAGYSPDRAGDDRVPAEIALLLGLPRVEVPFVIEGGNFLSNGQGLGIMTDLMSDDKIVTAGDEERFSRTMRKLYGLDQLVVLESLEGEPTGHVDMFATFPSADTVIIGSYEAEEDAENAAILDRNAELLAKIETENGPLRVIRIPMPTHKDGIWRTYTNVLYANGVVLVPIYPLVDAHAQMLALEVFSEALPGWQVEGIDASEVIQSSGALHCISMNLGPIGTLPVFPEPNRLPDPALVNDDVVEADEQVSQDLLLARRPFTPMVLRN